MFKLIRFFAIIIFIVSCATDNSNSIVNFKNLPEKVDEAIYEIEYDESVDLAVEVLSFVDASNFNTTDVCLTNKILCLRAQKQLTLNGYDLVEDYTKVALANEGCDDNLLRAYLYNLHGIFYHYTDLEKARENYKQAYYYANQESDKKGTIDALFNLASINFIKESYQKSIQNSLNGIENLKQSSEKKIRLKHFYINIANCYLKLEDYNNAKATIETLDKIIEEEEKKSFFIDDVLKAKNKVYRLYAALYEEDNLNLSYQYLKKADSVSFLREKHINIQAYKNLNKEIELNENLIVSNEKVIKNQRLLLLLSLGFVIIVLFITYKIYKTRNHLRNTLGEKETINSQLKESLLKLEDLNDRLKQKSQETQSLLNQNEKALFSKTLKLSNYKDSINNVLKGLNNLIDKNASVNVSKLITIEKSLKGILSEEEIWQDFKFEFEKTRPDFFKKLLEHCPSLSITEQKHCAYVVTNLKSKEVASILNLSPRSVETIRYRIKKKLNLKEVSLLEFLKGL